MSLNRRFAFKPYISSYESLHIPKSKLKIFLQISVNEYNF